MEVTHAVVDIIDREDLFGIGGGTCDDMWATFDKTHYDMNWDPETGPMTLWVEYVEDNDPAMDVYLMHLSLRHPEVRRHLDYELKTVFFNLIKNSAHNKEQQLLVELKTIFSESLPEDLPPEIEAQAAIIRPSMMRNSPDICPQEF